MLKYWLVEGRRKMKFWLIWRYSPNRQRRLSSDFFHTNELTIVPLLRIVSRNVLISVFIKQQGHFLLLLTLFTQLQCVTSAQVDTIICSMAIYHITFEFTADKNIRYHSRRLFEFAVLLRYTLTLGLV